MKIFGMIIEVGKQEGYDSGYVSLEGMFLRVAIPWISVWLKKYYLDHFLSSFKFSFDDDYYFIVLVLSFSSAISSRH